MLKLKTKDKSLLAKKVARQTAHPSNRYAFLAFDLSTEDGRAEFQLANDAAKLNRVIYEMSIVLRNAAKYGNIIDTESSKSHLLTKSQEETAQMLRSHLFSLVHEEKLDTTLA